MAGGCLTSAPSAPVLRPRGRPSSLPRGRLLASVLARGEGAGTCTLHYIFYVFICMKAIDFFLIFIYLFIWLHCGTFL